MHKFTKALAAIGLAAVMSQSAMAENLKLGFLVKQPEEPWFQTEWKFADKAGWRKNIERDRQPGCQWRKRFRYLYSGPQTRLCHRRESAWLRYESHCRG